MSKKGSNRRKAEKKLPRWIAEGRRLHSYAEYAVPPRHGYDPLKTSPSRKVVALGVSNQRESLVLWDRESGEPLSPLLSWQDRRTRSIARTLLDRGYGETVRRISGLPLDPMFSAVKATWLLTHRPLVRGARTGVCTTDIGNASRMSLLDIETGQWSAELLADVREVLPFIQEGGDHQWPTCRPAAWRFGW